MSEFLTKDEVEQVIEKTVHVTLTSMGVDTDDPLQMQRDFQALRDWRRASELIRSKGLLTIVGVLMAGIGGAIWLGVQHAIGRTP